MPPMPPLHASPYGPPPPSSQPSYHSYRAPNSYPALSRAAMAYPPLPPPPWPSDRSEIDRAEEMRRAATKRSPGDGRHYGESVKRHLDIFDIETSLGEVSAGPCPRRAVAPC
jgi:hypothetical protein